MATPKPLTDRHEMLASTITAAHVIMSWIPTHTQNLVTISEGVSFSRMREIPHQNVYSASFFSGYFQRPTAEAPEPIFT